MFSSRNVSSPNERSEKKAKPNKLRPAEYNNKLDASRGVHYCKTTVTDETPPLTSEPSGTGSNYDWSSSANKENCKDMPAYTMHSLNKESFKKEEKRLSDSDEEKDMDEGVRDRTLLLSVVKDKRKSMPKSYTFIDNCHILINNERSDKFILPLVREIELDKLASDRAQQMMKNKKCEHSDIENLIPKISDHADSWQRIGENVFRGISIKGIHDEIINNPDCVADKNNMYDRRFSSFGIGVATSSEGAVYVCQIYKG